MQHLQHILLALLMLLPSAALGRDDATAEVSPRYAEPSAPTATLPTYIIGLTKVSPEVMCRFVQRNNSNFSIEVAEAFYTIGQRYGIRGDVALCQAILETGWFKFMDGTAVTPDQYNFGGLGVTGPNTRGNSYTSLEDGVTAMIQHLYAYATTEPLPDGEEIIDCRFALVERGCAPTWSDLSGRWAINDRYGAQILDIYSRLLKFNNR